MKASIVWLLILLTIHAPFPAQIWTERIVASRSTVSRKCRPACLTAGASGRTTTLIAARFGPTIQGLFALPMKTPLGQLAIIKRGCNQRCHVGHLGSIEPIFSEDVPLLVVDFSLRGVAPGLVVSVKTEFVVSPPLAALRLASLASFREEP